MLFLRSNLKHNTGKKTGKKEQINNTKVSSYIRQNRFMTGSISTEIHTFLTVVKDTLSLRGKSPGMDVAGSVTTA